MMPRIAERLAKFMRNLVHRKPAKEIRRHCCSLLVVQLFQTLLNEAWAFFKSKALYGRLMLHQQLPLNFFHLHTRVISTALQMTPIVDPTRAPASQQQSAEPTPLFVLPQ